MGLSKKEALHFVTDILGISSPLKLFEDDPELLLDKLIKSFQTTIPFQNITLLSQPEAERHLPTWKEIKTDVMCCKGGICYTGGTFMYFLLVALGYETYIPAAYIGAGFSFMNHISSIVQNLTYPGSKHLVDVATGFPTYQAIPLDFVKESPIYNNGFLEYKFIIDGDIIARVHRRGDLVPPTNNIYVKDGWRVYSKLNLTPQSLTDFKQDMTTVYTKPGVPSSPFLVSFRAVLFRELKLMAIKDNSLMLENSNHEVEVTKLSSSEEMVKVVTKYFPKCGEEDVRKAIDYLKLFG